MNKKRYNRNTMSDMPMEKELSSSVKTFQDSKKKSKINVIGNKPTKRTNPKPEIDELEEIGQYGDAKRQNEEAIRNYHTKVKRNRVAIIILSVMLVLTVALLAIYIGAMSLETNCKMIIHNANATYIIDGKETNRFRAPSNLQGNRILKMEIQLRIDDPGQYKIKFQPRCYIKNQLLDNTLVYIFNTELFRDGGDGYFYTKDDVYINGHEVVTLCEGIILDYQYESSLNVDNFRMEFHTYVI